MKKNFTVLTFLFFYLSNTSLQAQVEKVYYQSLTVNDSTMQLLFDINDPHEVVGWNHEGRMMIEVTTRLDGANMDILGYLIKQGRYAVALDENYPVTTLRYTTPSRVAIKNKGEACKETVFVKIYIPVEFTTKKPINLDNNSLTTVPKESGKN